MKKFLVTLIVIILAVSVGFGVFYLVKDNEIISLKSLSIYKDVNDPFEVTLDMENPNSYTKVTVTSSDESVVKFEDVKVDKKNGKVTGTFTAVGGGNAKILFKTNNVKFRNISCDVEVCDGTIAHPYRIDTAEKLQSIGFSEKYTTDKCYILTNNIDLGTLDTTFTPISSLSGIFDGQGYTISNLTINSDTQPNLGLFREVWKSGEVRDVKIENAQIQANAQNTKVGTVVGLNKGIVSLVEVKSSKITTLSNDSIVGGVVGVNESINTRYERNVAKVDRVSANVEFGTQETGLKCIVGGVVGKNYGGVVINSYTKGNAYVKDAQLFGGIVAINEYVEIGGSKDTNSRYEGSLGANVKDCYSIINIDEAVASKMGYIIGTNTDNNVNKIVGNYYESNSAVAGLKNGVDYTYGEISQKGTTKAVDNLLKDLSSLLSYKFYNKKIEVENGELKITADTSSEVKYFWNLSVWATDSTQNDGYPILLFKDEHVDENFENSSTMGLITNLEQLNAIRTNLSGSYYISESIDLSVAGEWVPIGTKDQPFEGILMVADGVKLENLTISTPKDYAGFFGVIGRSGFVSGLNLTNVQMPGLNSYAGAIAGQNKGTIVDCGVLNSTVVATKATGGIAGDNSTTGMIANSSVSSTENNSTRIIATSTASAANSYGAGGIAGINYNMITNCEVTRNVQITATKQEGAKTGYANLGGIVAYNLKDVSNSDVYISQNTVDGMTFGINTPYSGIIGGIAAYSTGHITNVYVSARMTTIVDDSCDEAAAGGIVGQLNASDKLAISGAVVTNSYISSYNSGGAVGYMTTSYVETLDVDKDNFAFNGAQKVGNIDNTTVATVDKVAVEAVTLEGKYSGGLVCSMTKGIVKDSYTQAYLSADKNAGIVYTIGYSHSSKEGGVIFNVYSTAIHKQGTSYAVSNSEVHNNWNVLGLGNSVKTRTVGFIYNYYYLKSDNLKDPQTADPIDNLGIYDLIGNKDSVVNCRTESQMKSKSTWSFLSDVWSVAEGRYPTIVVCEAIKM